MGRKARVAVLSAAALSLGSLFVLPSAAQQSAWSDGLISISFQNLGWVEVPEARRAPHPDSGILEIERPSANPNGPKRTCLVMRNSLARNKDQRAWNDFIDIMDKPKIEAAFNVVNARDIRYFDIGAVRALAFEHDFESEHQKQLGYWLTFLIADGVRYSVACWAALPVSEAERANIAAVLASVLIKP